MKTRKTRILELLISRHQETNSDIQMWFYLTNIVTFKITSTLLISPRKSWLKFMRTTASWLTCISLRFVQESFKKNHTFHHTWTRLLQTLKAQFIWTTCSLNTSIDGESQPDNKWTLSLTSQNNLETGQPLIITITTKEPSLTSSGQKTKSSLMLLQD